MRLLVTGGCGYVGSKLTQALIDRTPCRVTVLDTEWFGNHLAPHPRLDARRLDVRAIDEIDLHPFDTIFHLANVANDPAVELNPYVSWEINVLATMRLAERAARHGVRQVIFASSGSVYGVTDAPQVTEDLELLPISEYNKTKMVAERVLWSYRDVLVPTIIRPATVCGMSPRMRLDLTVNLLTMQALTRGAMTVFGGAQIRPNIHVDDLVDLYLFAFERRLAGTYNAGFENLSVMEIAQRIAAVVPATIAILPSNDPRSYRLSSERLLGTGFAPKKNVAVAVAELAAAYHAGALRDQPEWHNVNWMKTHNLGCLA
jgi:nucleoside-diphosphate-sugar epimerase